MGTMFYVVDEAHVFMINILKNLFCDVVTSPFLTSSNNPTHNITTATTTTCTTTTCQYTLHALLMSVQSVHCKIKCIACRFELEEHEGTAQHRRTGFRESKSRKLLRTLLDCGGQMTANLFFVALFKCEP
jgi:Trk-type K+ transport system membrane component